MLLPSGHLRGKVYYDQLAVDAPVVLAELTPVTSEVQAHDGRWLHVDVRPYQKEEECFEGVIITLVDITSHNEREDLLLMSRRTFATGAPSAAADR